MLRNPFTDDPYVKNVKAISGRLYSEGLLRQKLRTIYAVWAAIATYKNNPDLTMDDASRELRLGDSLYKPLSRGTDWDPVTAKKILLSINNIAGQEASSASFLMDAIPIPYSEKYAIYNIALEEIAQYIDKAEIYLIKPKAKPWYDRAHWYEEATKCTHITMLLERDLGFDWLWFDHISDDDIINFHLFRRHHFRDDPNRKESLYNEDLFLTDAYKMNLWETFSEFECLMIMEAGQRILSFQDVDSLDAGIIDSLFAPDEWVYREVIVKYWYKNPNYGKDHRILNPNFNTILDLLKLKIEKSRELGHDEWLDNFYKKTNERFLTQYGLDFYSLMVRCPGFADYSNYMSLNIDWDHIYKYHGFLSL